MPDGKIAERMQAERSPEAAPLVHRRLFTADEYHRLGEAGILREDDRVELVDGDIVEMTPIGARHAACVDRLNVVLQRCLGDSAIVRVQGPVRLNQISEPQPDITVLKPRRDFYAGTHPCGDDILLAIEVADTSLKFDREVKGSLYARSAIAEFWLVDVVHESVEVFRQPGVDRYLFSRISQRRERLPIAALPDISLSVDDILG